MLLLLLLLMMMMMVVMVVVIADCAMSPLCDIYCPNHQYATDEHGCPVCGCKQHHIILP